MNRHSPLAHGLSWAVLILLFCVTSHCQKTWNGSISGDWNTSGNWTPAGVPGNTTNVVIPDAGTTTNSPSTFAGNTTCGALTLQANALLTLPVGITLTVNGCNVNAGATLDADGTMDIGGNVDLDGTFDLGSGVHTVGGAWDSRGGTILGTGRIDFEGTGKLLQTGTSPIPEMRVVSGDMWVQPDGSTNGTSAVVAGDCTVLAGAGLKVRTSAFFSFGSDTTTFTIGGNLVATGASLEIAHILDANDTAILDVNGNVSLTTTTGTMNASGEIFCAGDWTSDGSFAPSAGLLTFDGGGSQNISASTLPPIAIASGTNLSMSVTSYSGLDVPAGATVTQTASASIGATGLSVLGTFVAGTGVQLDVNGPVTVGSGGTFNLGTGTHTVAGEWNSEGGTLSGTAIIEFDGAVAARFRTGSSPVPAVRIVGADMAVQPDNASNLAVANVTGNVTVLSGGILRVRTSAGSSPGAGTSTLTIGGDLDMTGGTLNVDAIFEINDSGILDVAGSITLSGTSASMDNQGFIRCGGDWTSDGSFSASQGEITFDGSGTVSAPGSTLPRGVVDTSGTVDFDGSFPFIRHLELVSGTLRKTGGGTVSASEAATFSGGTLVGVSGTLDLNNLVTFSGTTCTAMPVLRCSQGVIIDANVQATSGRLVLDGSGSQVLNITGGKLNDLELDNTSSHTPPQALDLNGALIVGASATLGLGSLDHVIGGDLMVDGTLNFTQGTGAEIRITGTSIISSTAPLPDIILDAGAGTVTLQGTLTFSDDLTLLSGTLQPQGSSTVQGDTFFSGGSMTAAGGDFDCNGNVTFSGTTAGDMPDMTIAGTATFNAAVQSVNGVGTVTLDGGAGQLVTIAGAKLPNLVIDPGTVVVFNEPLCLSGNLTVGGDLTLTQPSDVDGNVTVLASGSLDFSATTLTCGGDFTVLGSLVPAGTLIIDGSNVQVSSVTALPSVQIDATGTVDLIGPLTINGDLTLVAGALQPNGITTINGTVFFQGGSMTADPGSTLVVNGDVIHTGTSITGLSNVTLTGNWSSEPGLQSPSQGTVTFAGTTQTMTVNGSVIHDVVIAGTSSTTVSGDLDLGGSVVVDPGGNLNLGSGNHTISESFTASGTLSGTGSLLFDGTGSVSSAISALPTTTFNGGLYTFDADVNGDLVLLGGILQPQGTSIINGTVFFDGGSMTATGATLIVTGDVIFSGTTTTALPDISLMGDWTSDANVNSSTGTITFDGTTQSMTVNGSVLGSMVVSTTSTTTVAGDLHLDGDTTVQSGGTLDATTGNHTFGGSYTADGTVVATPSGTWLFDGTGTISSAATALPNTTINGISYSTSGTLTFADDLTLLGGILDPGGSTIINGTVFFDGGSLGTSNGGTFTVLGNAIYSGTSVTALPDTTVGGDLTVDANFAPTTGTMTMNVPGTSTVTSTAPAGAISLNELILTEGVIVPGTNLSMTANVVQIDAGVLLDLGSSQTSLEGATMTVDGTLRLGAGGTLALDAAANVMVTTLGTLELAGDDGAPSSVTGLLGGGYGFNIAGNLSARHFVFQEPGAAGVQIASTATVAAPPNDFRRGTFDLPSPTAGSVLLDIQQTSPVDLRYLTFEDTNAVGTFNVRTTAGAVITLTNFSGAFSGPAFEDDPTGTLIEWAAPDETVLTAINATPGAAKVLVQWVTSDETSELTSFRLERATSAAGPFGLVATRTPAGPSLYSHLDSGLTPGTTYFYRLVEELAPGDTAVLGSASATPFAAGTPANVNTVGPNGAFADPQAAIDAAAGFIPPAMVLIEPGTYPPFTISAAQAAAINLRIAGDGTGPVIIDTTTGPVIVQDRAAGAVELAGLQIGDGTSGNPGLVLVNNAGTVIVTDCDVQGGAAAGIDVTTSTRVAIQRTSMTGAPGLRLDASLAYGAFGAVDAIDLVNTSTLTTCELVPASSSIGPSSMHAPLGGTMPDLQVPTSVLSGETFSVTITSDPGQIWLLFVGLNHDWFGSAIGIVEMIGLFGNFFGTPHFTNGITDATGMETRTFDMLLSPAIFGMSPVFQAAVVQGTTVRWSVAEAMLVLP